ncbi:PolC-type DNA polymerase III [Kyrpidia spormannii]|uniref:DNA polymerase III PolC-type n=1 Tax=Kyrpidia spormannii TaxID=2055160 RepID=A0A2K8N6K4_9BACL|nr:PolC-type DNA polymerase III [Kyrpidia spormannii]ATY84991.1 PolC-type DNA polymerase III [Kyrpidia spormannii]
MTRAVSSYSADAPRPWVARILQLRPELTSYMGQIDVVRIAVSPASLSGRLYVSLSHPLPPDMWVNLEDTLTSLAASCGGWRVEVWAEVADRMGAEEAVEAYYPICARDTGCAEGLFGQIRGFYAGEGLLRLVAPHEMVSAAARHRGLGQAVEAWYRRVLGLSIKVQWDVEAGESFQELREQCLEEERAMVAELVSAPEKEGPSAVSGKEEDPVLLGKFVADDPVPLRSITEEVRSVVAEGTVFFIETRELSSGRILYHFYLTDRTDSISVKAFAKPDQRQAGLDGLSKGDWVRVRGAVSYDTFAKELVLMAQDVVRIPPRVRKDESGAKRVELHVHTPMSALDGVSSPGDLVRRAAEWGHSALAVTDHGVAQAFPDFFREAQKAGIKPILGVEAYLVDDGSAVVMGADHRPLQEAEFVVFDTETTGLNAREHTLIEIAAVKVRGGKLVDHYASLIDPGVPISPKIQELTGITNDMVKGQPGLSEVLEGFRKFAAGAVLVAHNAEFDMGFLQSAARKLGQPPWDHPVLDTLALARVLYPRERNHRLKTLTQKFNVELVNHHRAAADAEATAKVFLHLLREAEARGAHHLDECNALGEGIDVSHARPYHATILVKNPTGLKNLYRLVSLAHTRYLHRQPRIPRTEWLNYREGLMMGTGCLRGELFQALLRGRSDEELLDIIRRYDFVEIQPLDQYRPLLRNEEIRDLEAVAEYHRRILELADRAGRPVVATGDVHYLDPEDRIYRDILQAGSNMEVDDPDAGYHFRTTEEMLEAFSHLGQRAVEVVVENANRIAEEIEVVKPIPDELYTPVIDGAEEQIRSLAYEKARRLYGDPLPELVEARLEKELNSIINHGYAVIYLIAHKLVTKSLEDGYLVGSRGSVGSSLVATMTDITEVNPLPPHYLCPACHYSEFVTAGSVGSGFDLPDRECPRCGEKLRKDGHDIPFETFMGFKGDKVPDIDLNFSGEYQSRAHKYTEHLFGSDHVFRAGTISTVAEKTAYGYVRKFAEERGLQFRNAELTRLVQGCTGIKRTTGQHPGGLMVVPSNKEIFDFCPIQFPADDKTAGTRTTHFDYHSIHDNLLKLDLLGHDDPTVIRMLQDLTGVAPKEIPVDDPDTMSIFSGTEVLGVTPEQIRSTVGTYGIPEFGTKFVRQMLEDTKPKTFAELVRISGLSHGTDVWLNNAQDLIRSGTARLSEVISTRDDIMVYLIQKGLEPVQAFRIMESVRKGKGLTPEDEATMKEHGVPDWYIASCKKIKYMFPKAHATAYVLMAVRIAYFKVHDPLAFYATYFTVRADDFDLQLVLQGPDVVLRRIEAVEAKGSQATAKEKSLLTVLEVALEMMRRGFRFGPLDLYRSDATRFLPDGEGTLIPPFSAVAGIGESAARNVAAAREEGEFLSVQDLQERARLSRPVVELLEQMGCLKDLPQTNQLSLF